MKRLGDPAYRGIGRSGDQKIFRSAKQAKGSLVSPVANTYKTLCAVVREIFDESPYERFLSRVKSERTIESYREFLRDRESVTDRKPRCC